MVELSHKRWHANHRTLRSKPTECFQRNESSLGYRVGAPVGYGLRRLMVDEGEHPKAFLEKGQFKALQSDRVRDAVMQ